MNDYNSSECCNAEITDLDFCSECGEHAEQVFRIPLNLDGYFVPRTVTFSKRNEIYVNSRLSFEQQSNTVATLRSNYAS